MQNRLPLLVLFDVDGTLLSTHGVAGRALATAVEEVFGVAAPLDGYLMAGKTDPQIVYELLAACGWPRQEVTPRLPEVFDRYLSHLDRLLAVDNVTVLPGVREVLAALVTDEHVRLGLLTGNIRGGAALKLQRAGLGQYFLLGAYGSDDEDRNRLVPIARARAAEQWGDAFEGSRTVVVGDAEADIRCARVGNARCVAVATGGTPAARLAQLQPDALLSSLADPAAVAALLANGSSEPSAQEFLPTSIRRPV